MYLSLRKEVIEMIKEIEKFLNKQYMIDFTIKSYKILGENHVFELNFGNDEIVTVVVDRNNKITIKER